MSFDYHVARQETGFDSRLRKVKDGEALDENNLEERSAEQIRADFNVLARTNAEQAAIEQSRRDADVFVKLHPEWMDTGRNARILLAFCQAQGISHPTLVDMDRFFPALVAYNLIELNQRELAKQEDSSAAARAKKIREEAFDEAEAYTMPLEEVRRRAGGSGGNW